MPGKFVILNVFGHGNRGDAMLLEALLDLLSPQISNGGVEGIAFDPVSEDHWCTKIQWHERICNSNASDIASRLLQLFRIFAVLIFVRIGAWRALKFILPKRQFSAIEAINNSDTVISCPGGYIEDSNFAFYINLLQIWVAKHLHCKVVLAPQSIGPVNSSLGRYILKLVLHNLDRIYYRERQSLAFLKSVISEDLDPKRYIYSGDLAFWFRTDPARRNVALSTLAALGVDLNRPIIGVSVISWTFPGSPNPDLERQKYISRITRFCSNSTANDFQVVIFNQVSSDLVVANEIRLAVSAVIVDQEDHDCSVFSSMIAQCDFFLASRFHSCIFALLGAVPCIALSYLPKTQGIMEDLGLSKYTRDIRNFDPDEIYKMASSNSLETFSLEIQSAVSRHKANDGAFNRWIATTA